MATITAAEANRAFSSLLRRASAGETVIVTSRGRPVAQIGPVREDVAAKEAAWQKLLTRLANQEPTGRLTPWTREDLYDHEPGSK